MSGKRVEVRETDEDIRMVAVLREYLTWKHAPRDLITNVNCELDRLEALDRGVSAG